MVPHVERHLFTVDEYHRMSEAGIFGEDDRVELIEGEIVDMSPINVGCGRAFTSRLCFNAEDDRCHEQNTDAAPCAARFARQNC